MDFIKTYKDLLITIDDVPYGTYTAKTLDLLDRYNMKAILFIISDFIDESNENMLINAIKNGHQLGNHGKTDSMHARKSYNELVIEIDECDKKIKELYKRAGVELPKNMYYRPGCGVFKKDMFTILGDKYELMLGTIATYDPFIPIPMLHYYYNINHINQNDIIVIHDRPWTPKMLEMLLPWMVKNNYRSVIH